MGRTVACCALLLLLVMCQVHVVSYPQVASSSRSGSQWVVESSFGAGVTINDVAFADDQHGWAAGNGGALFLTADGGQSWRTVLSGSADNLRRVSFTSAQQGYAAGDGSVLRTADGGVTWIRLAAPSLPAAIRDLAVSSTGTLVLATQPVNGTGGLFRSVDGGAGWQQVATAPSGQGFDRAAFAGPLSGWACGTAGLYHTTDGGQTWSAVDLHLSVYQALGFSSSSFGFIAGMDETTTSRWSATIARTADGGATWTTMAFRASASMESAQVHAVAFTADQQQGLAAIGSVLYDTQDGGATWTRHSLPRGDGASVTVVGYHGAEPFVVANGTFLHQGSLLRTPTETAAPAQATASVPATASATAPVPPSATSTLPASTLSFSSPTPSMLLPFSTATSIPFRIVSIAPSAVIAASGALLTIRGTGLDALATVTIGPVDITAVQLTAAGSLSFTLPANVQPGTYTVVVTEPDGRRGTLPAALTIQARLFLRAGLLHASVPRGATAVLLAQTLPGAELGVHVLDAGGHPLSGVSITPQRGPRGEWRVLLAVSPRVPLGVAQVVVLAYGHGQTARLLLSLRVVPAA